MGRHDQTTSPPGSPLKAEIDMFLGDRLVRGLSPRTIQYYRAELGLWQSWMAAQGWSTLTQVTPAALRCWLVHLSTKRNRGGVHASYRALRAFMRWLWLEYELTSRNPIELVQPARPRQEPLEPLALEDLRKLLTTCDRQSWQGCRDRALLLALLDTGCRASELLSLNVEDVDMSTGAVHVRHGKGARSRITFLGIRSRRELHHYLRQRHEATPDAPLWVTSQGLRLTYEGLRSMVRRHAAAVGMEVPSLHSFRRAFALTSLRNGVDIYSLQRLMGHADLTMLQRYLKQSDEDLMDAHRRTGPVDNAL